MDLVQILLAFALAALWTGVWGGFADLCRSLGGGSGDERRNSLALAAAGTIMLLALLVVVNPDVRLFLWSIDSIGIDLFATLCMLYFRHNLAVLTALLLIPALRGVYRMGPLPYFWPSKALVRSMPHLAAYAVLYPALWLFSAAICVTDAILHWSVLNS